MTVAARLEDGVCVSDNSLHTICPRRTSENVIDTINPDSKAPYLAFMAFLAAFCGSSGQNSKFTLYQLPLFGILVEKAVW